MEQSRQRKKRQGFVQKMKQVGWRCSILAVLFLGIDFTCSPHPFGNAKIDNFSHTMDTIVDAKIIKKVNISSRGSRNDFYELDINTSSGQTFHLKRPDYPGQLTHYLAVLPIGKEVFIRYFNRLFDSHVILEVKHENQIFIPFSEIMADENQKRHFMHIWTGIFALLGIIGFCFGRRKQEQHSISEHIQTQEKCLRVLA